MKTMAYYRTQDFDRMVAARNGFAFVPAHELEYAARRMRAEAIAENTTKAFNVVKGFFATRPEPPEVNTFEMSEQDKGRLAQAEAIADAVIAVSTFIARTAAAVYAPIRAWRIQMRTREELDALDDRALADIGLTRGDIRRVAAGIWVPENRSARIAFAAPSVASNLNKPQIAA
jgi:uncharacterized protein YjiS (DUF1127 family)